MQHRVVPMQPGCYPCPLIMRLRRDPFYYRNRRQRMMEQQERQGGMNFLEAIFRWACWGREDGKMGGLALVGAIGTQHHLPSLG